MHNLRSKIILILCVISMQVCAQEFRGSLEYKHRFNPRFKANMDLEMRNQNLGQDIQNFTFLSGGISYHLNSYMRVSSKFRYGFGSLTIVDEVLDDDYNKYRLNGDLRIRLNQRKGDYNWFYRMRYQYSYYSDHKEKQILRNQLQLSRKFNKNVEPNLRAEVFYNLTKSEMTKIRLYVGCEFNLSKNPMGIFLFTDYYMNRPEFTRANALGLFYSFG